MNKSITSKEKSKIAFDKQADHYDSTYYGQHARKLYESVIETMNKYDFKSVLDVGCGTGNVLLEVIKRKSVDIAGIDLSEKMLDIARRRIGNSADLRSGDSEHLPWDSAAFDMIICTDSFHHYPHPLAVLEEMKRVLTPNGKIVIADAWMPPPLRQLLNIFMPFSNDGDVKMYSQGEMKKLMYKCGLKFENWQRIGNRAFITVAKKG
ncbi:class I SAM-dependent methyltransferase [Ruminiclostridium cellobioparum]|uniref:Methylase involved in ubiquinone/menaquinone biosynthesis n=1 Tax=Ruminiclostridium cellobioparum subsp. termitidis CT1112 TaxID=1195236 RepID=S0FXU6_RUMCE|nr:class I SAM-dependent methyltransferase [Ruminiclostridium cellobioparum]EMS73388.1 Methylase involved in ubiquinone/menaquinone biosynthesis [Ruminiclostridium cellobioparum subsp. termitidis CT1112]